MQNQSAVYFLFSGQGSQYYHMGAPLLRSRPVFRRWMEEFDERARPVTGLSLVDLLYDKSASKAAPLSRTLHSHPLIFMVEYALAADLIAAGCRPRGVLGMSLGECAAAAVAGILSPQDAFDLVLGQADLFERTCPPGGMLTVLAPAAFLTEAAGRTAGCSVVARNLERHGVIAGPRTGLEEIARKATAAGYVSQLLPVEFAFHAPPIEGAALGFRSLVDGLTIHPPAIPFWSAALGGLLTDAGGDHFWNVVRRPMDFPAAAACLPAEPDTVCVDLSPSGTLAGFLRQDSSHRNKRIFDIMTPYEKDIRQWEAVAGPGGAYRSPGKESMQTIMFPGQGSQHKGMGKDLFSRFPGMTKMADEILGYSIADLCLEGPPARLTQTEFTQPALYTVCALTWLAELEDGTAEPDFFAGHSLGEYCALFAAGCYDFGTGLRLVQKRGEIMSRASGGTMAAVLGRPPEEIRELLDRNNLGRIDIANINAPGQVVIAGPEADIRGAAQVFQADKGRGYIPINVSAAFHSRYMQAAADEFRTFLQNFTFRPLRVPVVANLDARPHADGRIMDSLVGQITGSVRWSESICWLMGRGNMEFKECGPGAVLTGLAKRIQKEGTPLREPWSPPRATDLAAVAGDPPTRPVGSSPSSSSASAASAAAVPVRAAPAPEPGPGAAGPDFRAETLGDAAFRQDYGLRYAGLAGAMYKGIGSADMVIAMGRAGLMGFVGAGGLNPQQVEAAILKIKGALPPEAPWGMNLLNQPGRHDREEAMVDLYLKHGVHTVEAAAYMQVSPALVRYRLSGLRRDGDTVHAGNRVLAKISRPEVAAAFLAPPPEKIVRSLLEAGRITPEQAKLAPQVPMADDLTVEADSGGHTDQGIPTVLMPAMLRLRDAKMQEYGYRKRVRVGAAGGIGTPEAAAAAFVLGADYILTGSINQATVEAGTSDAVKDILVGIGVQDTEYAPAGDMFEMGAKVQVVRKGLFFPARANKLYSLYTHHSAIDEIDAKTQKQIQEKYFRRSFDVVWREVQEHSSRSNPAALERAMKNPRVRMAMIFKWYFAWTTRLAMEGSSESRVDYQIHCGPALGAFNQWVAGSDQEDWHNRRVDRINVRLLEETARLLGKRFAAF